MTLRIPLPELNGHPQNQLSLGGNVSWQLHLPYAAYADAITMNVTGVDAIMRPGLLDGLFVLPAGRSEGHLDGYLHSGFESRLDVPGNEIASNALHNGGSYVFEACRLSDGALGSYGCVLIDQGLINAQLRGLDIEDRSGNAASWAEALNTDFVSQLGEIALEHVRSHRNRSLREVRPRTTLSLIAAIREVKDAVKQASKAGGLITTQNPTDQKSLARTTEPIKFF